MFQQMKKRIKNEKGLTLIELLAVIVILAIIAAIAIPAIGNIIQNSRDKAILSEALNIISGGKLAHIEQNCGGETNGCTGDTLEKYVDGIDVSGVKVKLVGDQWKISGYTKFGDIDSNSKYNVGTSSNEVDESTIKGKLGEKDDSKKDDPKEDDKQEGQS